MCYGVADIMEVASDKLKTVAKQKAAEEEAAAKIDAAEQEEEEEEDVASPRGAATAAAPASEARTRVARRVLVLMSRLRTRRKFLERRRDGREEGAQKEEHENTRHVWEASVVWEVSRVTRVGASLAARAGQRGVRAVLELNRLIENGAPSQGVDLRQQQAKGEARW